MNQPQINHRVFISHGKDNEILESVARFLEKMKLSPIILQELPNEGKTIIEKFERHADVDFAVILLTPDDLACLKGQEGELFPRARQNVLFELGYFIGKLGRNRVVALFKGNVEIPSNYRGVLFAKYTPEGAWKINLIRELRAAGVEVDGNGLL